MPKQIQLFASQNPDGTIEVVQPKAKKVKTAKTPEPDGNAINELMGIFYRTINPTINFANKTQKDALRLLVAKFGFDQVKRTIEYAVAVQGQTYAPTITTPYQLKEKLGALKIYFLKQQATQKKGRKIWKN